MADDTLIDVQNLKMYFPIRRGVVLRRHVGDVKAVDDVSFGIERGETLGLVGESGCGKSTTGRALLQLYKPTGGSVMYDGQDLTTLDGKRLNDYRKKLQIVFQDPYASLNPRMTVENIISEGMVYHGYVSKKESKNRVNELLKLVGLRPYAATRYPHEFSGGQRQRIGIARALAMDPDFIVCDEPISALDVSIQAQVVNLLADLKDKLGLTYLFIAHDLSMVRHISDRVAVMYLGKIAEISDKRTLFAFPKHPYTQALLDAVPVPDPAAESSRDVVELSGDVPSPSDPPKGCNFSTRCPHVMDICREVDPAYRETAPGQLVACHLY
jgi:oligopeptide transport system ATP-binding protein